MFLPTTLRIPSIVLLLSTTSVVRTAIVQKEQSRCTWPDTDTLFIIDSTLGISSYDHVLEIKFLEQILSLMRISSNQSRIALAQFTPQSRHEFSLASEGRDNAFAAVQRLQFVGCDSSVGRSGCQPTASVNSIASFSLREGNRKSVPDVIVVISSSKWPIPELRPKETLMSPISPIHSFYILVGANSAPQRRFEPAATSIMLTALDFSSLTQIVEPLCRSVNHFVFYGTPGNVPPPFNNTGGIYTRSPLYPVNVQTPRPDLHVPWDHFSPLAWTITALLILVFFIILLALGLAVWQYRDENNRLKRRLSEQEVKIRQQNEYFTGKLHKQMEAEIAARDKFEEELRKTEEKHIHHAERLERRLEKHLDAPREAPIPPPPPPPPPQPIIIPAFFGGANGNEKPKRSSSLETAELEEGKRHRSGRRRSSLDFGSASTDQSRGRVKKNGGRKKKKGEHLDKSMIVLPSGRRIRGNLNELITARELHDLEEELETSRRLGRMTDRLKLKNELSRLDHALSQTETAWKSYLANRRRSSDDSGVSVERLEGGRVVHYQGSLPFDHPARILPPIDLLFLVDSSSSIGLVAFEQIKQNIDILLKDVDIAPGRSRVAMIQFARQPSVVFGFDKYFSAESVKRGINRMPYTGGATYMAKALSFAAGVLWHEQNLKEEKLEALENAPIPRHDRLQILIVVSDGSSEDNVDKATAQLHEQLQVKVAGLVTRNLAKEKLTAVTRFDGAVFVMDQTESINIWLWRQQRLWMDNYEQYLEREKTIITEREERKKRGQSVSKSPKKKNNNGNSANQMSKLKLNSSLRTARSIKPLSFL
uniref:VWFA domain-containing protein n=1 Tax=Pristionchus pacificus TaxID=54126 RepID=A0A8R1YJK5_PRIPA